MDFIVESNEIYLLDQDNIKIAYVKFPKLNDYLVEVTSTYVSETLRGQGVAGKLMKILYDELKRTNRKAKMICSYAVSWFDKNVEKQDILG